MKVVIVGASAFSTPALFDLDPPLERSRFRFAFVGRNLERLAAVKRAATLVARSRRYEPDIEVFSFSDLASAISGAAVVLIQLRVGGYVARTWDETFPHRHRLCGDEGLGPGGLAAAWRTWPALAHVLATIAASAPGAAIVVMTAPLGILLRCAILEFPKLNAFGICELPWTTLTQLCRRSGVDVRDASFDYVGTNHIGWFTRVTAGERTLVDGDAPLPLKYVRLHTNPAEELSRQRAEPSRAGELEKVAATAFPVFEREGAETILEVLRRRPTPWYSEAVGPLLNALAGAHDDRWYFLTTRNDGYLGCVPDQSVIEIPHKRVGSGFHRAQLAHPAPADIERAIVLFVAYEKLAADAVLNRSIADVSQAIQAHPWVGKRRMSPSLVRDIVAAAG